ncbi:MAG: carboxypeptidase regulatory-like domain-containing protein [Nitrospirae bacterium]|nr:carboxypeptidase regulatory-like domain-containing protein [Nitrospirota bacterium]
MLLSLLIQAEYSLGEGIHGYITNEDNTPVDNADVSIFDGLAIRNVKTDDQGIYKIPEISVTPGNYAVLFFTKKDYIPKAVNIRVNRENDFEYSAVIKKTDAGSADLYGRHIVGDKPPRYGFVIGTIYQPIRGGKIKFQSGIYGFGRERRVWLEGETGIVEKRSDMDGHFFFEVPPGKYRLGGEVTKEKAEVDVREGETVIRSLRSGLILID